MNQNDIIYVSSHAKGRIKERCGISKKKALRCAEKAVSRGIYYEETKGSARKWLEGHIHEDGHQIYVYGDKAFLFSGNMLLVTVLQLPAEITRYINYDKKKASRANVDMMSVCGANL